MKGLLRSRQRRKAQIAEKSSEGQKLQGTCTYVGWVGWTTVVKPYVSTTPDLHGLPFLGLIEILIFF